jgi:hypothetical protein
VLLYWAFDYLQQSLAAFFGSDGQSFEELSEEGSESFIGSRDASGVVNLDDLVGGSGHEDLQLASFIKRAVHEGEQALMGDVRPEVGWIFFEFVDDVVGMVVSVEEHILMFFESAHFKVGLVQYYDDLSFILDVFLD